MIKSVTLNSPEDGDSYVRYEIVTVYDDGYRRIEHKMNVSRGIGRSDCNNPEGTSGMIEVYGNFTYTEAPDGTMVMERHSKDAIDEAVVVFKAMNGESEPDD